MTVGRMLTGFAFAQMFADMAPSEELELDVVRHCILVAFTPPHELRCRMSVDERYDNMVLNDVAEVMKEVC